MYQQLHLSISYVSTDFPTKISWDILISAMRAVKCYSCCRYLEVAYSNQDPDTNYNALGFLWFSSVPPSQVRSNNLTF